MSVDDFQQYRCMATGCKGKRRVPIKPSLAPMDKHLNCELCGSRQRHRSDGGSGCVDMIDLNQNPDISRAELLGKLRSAHAARTPIREDGPESPYICLRGEDTGCSACGSFIGVEAFGEESPYFRILGQQKRARGETHCPDCIPEEGER